MNFRKKLVLVHRILGLWVGVVLIPVSLSGFLLLFKAEFEKWKHPEIATPISGGYNYPNILELIEKSSVDPVTTIKFPQPDFNAFVVWYKSESKAFISPTTGQLISQNNWYDSLMPFVLRVHTQLLMAKDVEIVNAVAGILAVFVLLAGFGLWWSRRKVFKLRHAVQVPQESTQLPRFHSAWGVMLVGVMLVSLVTGVVMVFFKETKQIVMRVAKESPEKPSVVLDRQDKPKASWEEILKQLDKTLPLGQLTLYYPPKPNNAVLKFRKKMPEEWHPNGRSYVLINPYDASVLQVIDARNQPPASRLMQKVFPLHGAFVGGFIFKAITGLGSIVLAGLALSGFIIWRRNRALK